MISLSFYLFGNVWISPHFWRTVLPDIRFLVASFILLALWICQLTILWPPKFLMRNVLIILLRILCMWWMTSLLLPSRFCFCLLKVLLCLSVDLFEFIFFGVWWASSMFIFTSFIKFGNFQPLFLQILSLCFPFSLLLRLLWWVYFSTCSTGPLSPACFFSTLFFLFLRLNDFQCPIFSWFFLLLRSTFEYF